MRGEPFLTEIKILERNNLQKITYDCPGSIPYGIMIHKRFLSDNRLKKFTPRL